MVKPTPRTRKGKSDAPFQAILDWPAETELVGLVFELTPRAADYLYAQYTIGLHAWFLDQVRQTDPELSAYLHDGESEKPFTVSSLEGALLTSGKEFQLQEDEKYYWYVTALSSRVVRWMSEWIKQLPAVVELRNAPLEICSCEIALPATTYRALYEAEFPSPASVRLSFTSPTSFRRKGHHLPLPWPVNVFHSYSRRWNDFSQMPVDQEAFLEWVDEKVLINRHKLESAKVAAGKKGMVTGFTGSVEYRLVREATTHSEFERLFYTLGKFAPYCGTGHKTTFGLGQTRLGSLEIDTQTLPMQTQLAQRIEQIAEQLMATQKRTGGERAAKVSEVRATILARQEFGESLQVIADDLEMPYETVKTYAKLARRALKIE